jgi:hypothetical protein
MVIPCVAPLPYPNCTDQVSLFTTAVFVLSSLTPNRCFYEGARPGCTMPGNLTEANGFYPVQPSVVGNTSEFHGELAVSGTVNLTVAHAVRTVYLQEGAGGELRLFQDDVVIRGVGPHSLERLVLYGQNVSVSNATVAELVFPNSVYRNMRLEQVRVRYPLHMAPHGGAPVVDVGGSVLSNVNGSFVSLLHPRGTLEIDGATEVVVLPQTRGAVFETTGTAPAILDVGELIEIFGGEYLVEFEAGELVVEALEAEQLAHTLILPTVIAVVTVILAWGDRLRG